ncbi:protein SON isoform X1 [Tympanuchus pallidicinctus]|uniref:protein SON isoform X1 n=1 Tax=Tympanuchus pallidicinctus TaxID=109042 RepID=UPI0022875FBE|nr:protein SON isoform X1 [Tympanuchus pallidicinctus]
MATNIEQIFRSFVVNKFREIQEEQQQQHGGGKVEGQPNGDTVPAEQANPSDDTVAGAGSRQNDQIVQKIEEVLSGALDTELQSKSDVDKTTVSNSTQSTKRSSTAEGEDEIPRKKSKKNKKHKSKKKKKKKKKRKKEKKHKKQPKESKLSARRGEHVDSQPASLLIPEKSSSTLSVQHGGFGDANLAVHIQPEGLSLQANVELDRQALGLASQLITDSQPCVENLESEKGTLCATGPQFNLEGSQFIIQQNASMTQTEICTREEQIKQSHENIYPVAVNVSEKGDFFITGSVASTSIPSGVASTSELQKLALPSEVKTLDTSLASNTTEVLAYSEASLKTMALGGTKELETTSESICLTSDVTTIPKPADLNTVKVTDMSMAMGEVRIPGATELPVVSDNLRVTQCSSMESSGILKAASESVVMMGDVKNKEVDPDAALEHSFKVPAVTAVSQVQIESAKTPLAPGSVEVKDIEPVRVSLPMGNVRPLEEVLQPVIKPKTSEAVMVVRETSDSATALNTSEVLLQRTFSKEMQSWTDANVVAEAKGLQRTSEPVVQTLIPQTVPVALQLENSNVLSGLEATPQSLQKEDMKRATSLSLQMESMKASEEPSSGSMEAKRETAHLETVAVPFFASKTESCIVSQSEIGTGMRGLEATSQTVFPGEKKDFEVARSSTIAAVRGLDNLAEVKAVAEARGTETGSKTACLTGMKNLEMAVGSETKTQIQDWGTTVISDVEDLNKAKVRSRETVLEPVQTVTVKTSDTNSKPVCLEELGTTIEYETGSEPNKIEAESRVVKVVEHSKTTLGPLQDQVVGNSKAALESCQRVEETVMEVRNLKETLQSEILTDTITQESGTVTRKADREKIEFSPVIDVKGLEESSGIEKGMKAKYLEPASEAGEVRLESMEKSAAAEGKGSETVKEPEVYVDIQGLETSQKYGKVAEINVLADASEAFSMTKQHIESVPQYLSTGTQEHAQTVLEAKPTAEWKSTEEAAEIWGAAEMKSEAVPRPEDTQDLGTMLAHEVSAEVQYSEGQQCQQKEDVRISSLALECEMVAEKNDSEQALPLEPFIALSDREIATKSGVPAETIFSSSHAANVKDSTGTPESEIIRDAKHLEGPPSCVAETEGLEMTHISETVVEMKVAEAVEEAEADTKDLEAAPAPETVTEVVPVLVEEASQLEAIPQVEADKEVAAEEASETRDSETSDVQPDVAARMRETLMRLEKVIEKSSHRSSEKSKHDSKKQKRSRSKSQSRSRKRKKKSRSRSTSRRLTSKRARSRSRNYSDSRKKHSKSRSRSVEKRDRRVSSRRSRRRRSRSSDRYRSKSRSVEKTRRSRRRRSRSSDRYRSKSRSVEKRESRLSSRRSRRRRSRSSDRYRSKSRSAEKRGSRLSSRRSRRGRSRSSDRYRSKSRSVEKTRRSGRRRSRSSDRYRSKSRSVEKTRRSGRRRSRSSDHYRSKSRSVEKTRRSGRRRSRSSDRYRSKSPSVEKRGSRLSSWRSRRRRSRSSDHSKSRSRSSEKRGGKEYSWRFRHRGSGSSDRSKSRSRSVEKRGRKASLRRSKRRRSKSSDHYKSRSRSVEKRDRKQSSRKSKRQRSKSSDGYKSRSKSVEKKKESSRKSKRRRSKSSERYKSRSRSVEKKRKDSSKKSKRKRSKSSDSFKSRSKSVEKRASKLASAKCGKKHADSSEQEKVDGSEPVTSEISSSKSSNGPMSVALSLEGINGPELPPPSESGFSKTVESLETSLSVEKMDGPQPTVIPELDSSKTSNDQEQCSIPVEKTQVSVTSENGSATLYDSDLGSVPAEKTVPLESSSLTELTFSASSSVSSSIEKRDAETTSVTEFHLSTSHQDESRSTSFKETEGAEPLLTNESGCSVSADDYKSTSTSSGNMAIQGFSLMSESVLSDGCELRHIPAENAEPQKFLQVPQSGSSELADSTESFETAEVQKPFLAPEVTSSEFLDVHESVSLPVAQGQMELPSLASDNVCFRTPDRHELGSSFGTQTGEVPLISEGTPLQSPVGKLNAPSASLASECGPVEITVDHISTSSSAKIQEVFQTTVGQSCKSSEAHESSSSIEKDLDGSASSQVLGVGCFENSEMHELGHLPAEKIEVTESALSTSGIPLCHRGHVSKYSYFEKTKGVDTVELVSTSAEKCEATDPCLTTEGGLSILPDSHELRATQTENVEGQKSSSYSEQKCIISPDEHQLRSPSGREIEVQEEQPLVVERRHSVSSDDHELTLTTFKKVDVGDPSQMPGNENTVGFSGPELTSTSDKAEVQEVYLISKERCSVSSENQELLSPAFEKTEVQEPALTSENEYAVSWKCRELRTSSPEKVEMQELSVVPDSECAVYSGDQESQTLPAGKAEVQMHSLMSENEYDASPESQDTTAISAETRQEPSAISDNEYVVVPRVQELSSPLAEKTEVQECSVLSENEYDISPEGHDLRSSPVEKEEIRESSETSESESSMSTDDQELQSTAAVKTEVQELSLMSEGECAMSPEVQELQTSPADKVESEEPSLTYENEHAVSCEEYESRSTHGDKTEDMDSSLTSERDHYLSFKSQEVRFTTVQKVDVQELSPTSESEHAASPDSQELRFLASGQVGDPEPLTLNDRGSMSPDVSDLKSTPVEKMDDAMPLMPERGCSTSPDGNSVKFVPGEETGDLEPPLTSECIHSTSPYHESHEVKSPMEEDGLESSVTFEHRRSITPEGHDEKSVIDEEIEDREPSSTSEHRRSTSPDEHESRSSIGEEVEYSEQPLTMEHRSSISSDEHDSRSTAGEEVEDVEPSLTGKRRDSTSSDEHDSRSTTGEEDHETSLAAERRDSVSSDEHDSRSTAGEEVEDLEPLAAEHRRSVSPDGRESRSTTGEEAEDLEPSLTAERRHSTSSDERESRSTTGEDVEDVEPSLTAERRDSTSSDEQDSRSTTGEEAEDMELSLTTEHRRSTSPDGRESRSTTGEEGEDVEPSLTAERRDSTSSDDHESRSTTGEEVEDMEPSLAVEDKHEGSPSIPLEKSEGQDSSFMTESRRSESSEREKSRSESAEKMSDRESSQRSRSRPSKSPRQMSRSPSVDKAADEESSRRSRHRRSRSVSVEKAADKESSRRSRHRRSRSTSVDKTADKESSRRSRRRRSRSTARQRSQSKSVDKTADKESSRRSRSRRSRSSQRRSQRYDADSRSRRNRSRSVTRRRASRSKSNRRSRSSSLSRSRHRRRSRSRSASRRRRSLSRDRRRRSQRNRSRSADRRRRRSDSRDRRISLRLRSRSRTPLRQRRSRSRGRRRSSSRSPIRLRRSRSSGRRRGYSRSPDRRRSRSSERFASRSPKRLTDLDKAQLLEIAKANAAAMCAKSGVPLPPSLMPMLSQKKDDKASQKSSRDTLKELTEKCKKIAQSTDDVIVNKPHVSDEEEEERPFYNHPFKLNEPKPIFFNLSTPSIKPAPPPQPKNQVSLSKEFPVSSGSQHRKKEADSVYGEWVPVEKGKEDSKDDVFPKPSIEGVDITAAMNDRALAQKRLNENTFDLEAMCMLNRAQEQIDAWAQSNSIPGQFTGSTGAQILSSDELTNSGPQAWIRKDQFLRAAPVTGGMGAQLMRKMGWREGEGLGKNKEGSVEPIMVDFKTDRKGLVAVGEKAQKRSGHYVVMKDLSGKHPVSALMEICNKRRWSPPEFVLVDDSGPDHRKHFIFKVRVNGNEYRPTFASLNKKHAKATAATAALQAMGLVPKESMVNTTMFRSASHR